MNKFILEVENLSVWFPLRRTISETFSRKPQKYVKAVDGVSFSVKRGEIFCIVGESGCGKTTIAKSIMGLIPPTSGTIIFDGKPVEKFDRKHLLGYRRITQMIFQDPYASLNPRFRIRDVIEEPLLIHGIGTNRAEREKMVIDALTKVRLIPVADFIDRFPHMVSGGQRQRVAVARTLVLGPKLIVADEPVSMLDLSIRAEILQLLRELKEQNNLTYLYITHDLSTARYFTDRIGVMYLGKIVEIADSDALIDHAKHPYTDALIAAVPEPIPERINEIKSVPIKGEIPSAANIPPGCRFHPRCPYAQEKCRAEVPELREIQKDHFVACHFPLSK